MVADLVGGQVQVAFDVLTGSLAHIRSGSLRALGMAGKSRSDALPEVPTIGERWSSYRASGRNDPARLTRNPHGANRVIAVARHQSSGCDGCARRCGYLPPAHESRRAIC